MEREHLKARSSPFVPPGFEGLTSFQLNRIHNKEAQLPSEPINLVDVQKSLVKRPWILHNQSSDNQQKDDTESAEQPHTSLETRLPEGVIRGCPSCSDCLKVTARWRPEEGRKEILEEVPVFHPTEEEFRDTINFIASIRSKVEPYGICRIVPPPFWTPPSLLKKNNIWEGSIFVPRVQQIAGIQCPNFLQKVASANEDTNAEKRRRSNTEPSDGACNNSRNLDKMDFESLASNNGPEFTLKSFKKYAEDFKSQYFIRKDGVSGLVEPTLDSIEGEYRRIVENPSEEIEVLHGHDICSTSFGSGFPEVSSSSEALDKTDYMRTGWNLKNLSSLPGSLLAYETCDTCRLLAPRLQVGMCFSSQLWRVEEHHLYSLCYMHDGAPRIIYSIPGSCSLEFEAVIKKQSPSSVQYGVSHNRRVRQPAISSLKSESIPVYRCVQYPGEFVLVLPRAYRSAFDSGFNCTEEVNFAPLDWLPHGQNVLELYCGRRRKTSLSHDKILLGAAQDAVKAHWLSKFRMTIPNKLLKWIDICKKDAVLANALKLRVKCERINWEYLAASLATRRRDANFDASSKKECCICFCDLHLSAVGCSCSPGTYSCLGHAKQCCPCPWGSKFVLILYEINELDTLTAALEGKLSSVHKWATEYLGLSLHKTINGSKFQGKASELPCLTRESEHNKARFQEAARPSDVGKIDASSITAQPKAYVRSNSMNRTNSKEITNSSAANSVKTLAYSSLLQRKRTFESSSGSSSDSSSSDSDVELIAIRNHSTKK